MKVKISIKDMATSVELDGTEIADKITGFSLSQRAMERPLLTVTFAPDEIELEADRIYVRKDREELEIADAPESV